MRNLPQLSEGPAPLLPEPLRQQFSGVATRWQLGTLPKWRDAARTFFHQSSFATHAIANEQNTVKVSKKTPLELLGPLGCGIQTGAGAVMNALDPRPGSSIAIFGCGSVGLSAVLGAVVTGCTTIIVVDLVQSRLDKALELGATHVVNAGVHPELWTNAMLGFPQSEENRGEEESLQRRTDCIDIARS